MTKLIAVTDTRTYDDNGEPEPMAREDMEICQHCGKRIFIVYEVEIKDSIKLIGSECYRKVTGQSATKSQVSVAMQMHAAREIVKQLHADNAKELCKTWTMNDRIAYWTKFNKYTNTACDMATKMYYEETK
jgi:hypothetical protein